MDSQVQNDSTMQYSHLPLQDRRDPNLDPSGSTPFHPNGLGQALSSHLAAAVPYSRSAQDYRNPSTSPPTLPGSSSHAPPATSPLTFTTPAGTSPAIKRKQIDASIGAQLAKRRRNETNPQEDTEPSFDLDGNAQGAKHWTDDEKTRLFEWLMGPGQEEHWNALRATKNSCLRECAIQVFGGKKTYQALKGCYERNFNLFKQIYAFENAHGQGAANMTNWGDADRLREYERRLQIARKTGSDVGNITARTIDHWHRVGWYDLFYQRWHGDPATMRPVQSRNTTMMPSGMGGGNDEQGPEEEDPTTIDFTDPTALGALNGVHDRPHVYINPQDLRDHAPAPPTVPQPSTSTATMRPPPPPPPHPQPPPLTTAHAQHLATPGTATPADTPVFTFTVTQDMLSRCLQHLSMQTKIAQERLEILRRREAREINEWNLRKDVEKNAMVKDKTVKAFELLNDRNADPGLRQAATEYIRKMFMQD